MKNEASFLGYSKLSAEITAGEIDHREQFDLSTEHALPGDNAPRYHSLRAPNQWPLEKSIPGFREAFTAYMTKMSKISFKFTSLVAEAIGLPVDSFNKYFDPDQQHRLKIVRYPDISESGHVQGQGVGPHKDSMLTSYLLQVTEHKGLQAQNAKGEWVDCPPIDGTLVVAIGQGLEALTQGVCKSTTHRVLSPTKGAGDRLSIPFFQGVKLDTEFEELDTVGVGRIPEEIQEQRSKILAESGAQADAVEFTFRKGDKARTIGEATLRNRVKSHQDVGLRWYPDIYQQLVEENIIKVA